MKTLSIVLLLACFLPSFSQSDIEKEKQEIIQLENHWLASVDNPQALESILADDFLHVLPTGIITKRQQLDFQRKHPRKNPPKRSFGELTVRIYGDTAVANGIVMATNKAGATRKTYFTDVFAKRNGQWQAVNAQENLQETPFATSKP